MTLPLLGAALRLSDLDPVRSWILDAGRPVEIQDFVSPAITGGDASDLVKGWRRALDGHRGPRGLHGPFFGLDISSPDAEIREIVQRRLLRGLEIAEMLGADQMVIHSPFTMWHRLNYVNYGFLRETLFAAAQDCLAPVLDRAAGQGCMLVLENIDDTDPLDRGDLVDRIGHPCLGLSIDTGHAALAHANYGAPPVVDFIAQAGGRLAHVHLQDVDGHADRHWHPGDGVLPWPGIFRALAMLPVPPRLILEVRADLADLPRTVARLEARGLAR
ncbi:sugar phosphate isomerase/epimerase [Rubellimicrobium sp. CFH 75288]|uniref:sugar phosphate isomerase/epimerase family protein n=1 Tax=Rubellimicrobium sp. CFH 75288 TaxID=2697034 RepID=UPI0014132696|nr:sugar phosphate isomerase/epimerase family protein [Rubellimicrobium sp. CFH 75288]NAZ36313.1 TIM barrel protein [Rubellimicrobium sp. CFH 75288]